MLCELPARRCLLWLLTLTIAGALAGMPAAAQSTPAMEHGRPPSVVLPPALERVLRDYESAWADGDGERLAMLFTRNGFIRQRNWLTGRAAIRERYGAVAGGPLRLRAVGYAAGDRVAHIVGAWGYGEEALHRDDGVFLLALERDADGRWLIRADLDHGIAPAEPPSAPEVPPPPGPSPAAAGSSTGVSLRSRYASTPPDGPR